MIRGTRKQMIVLRTGRSRYFDTAYFVLRERASEGAEHADILYEANRILAENADARKGSADKRTRRRAFIGGLFCGSLGAFLLSASFVIAALTHGWFF